VAYRTDVNTRDRSGAIAAVIAVHAALVLVFLHLNGNIDETRADSVLRVFNLTQPPPPPPPPPPPQQKVQPKPKEKEGGSAPPNVRSQATPVKAPKPKVIVPPVPQIAASPTPRQGTAPTQGASNVAGTGTGAGGSGNGTGSGNGGNGSGGGGDGGVADLPHLITPVLTGREIPRDLIDQWPHGRPLLLRLRVDARGYVIGCDIVQGTGVPVIDGSMCNIAHDRLRFKPAVNRSGQPVAGWFGYGQRAPR
jgi:protein TonB